MMSFLTNFDGTWNETSKVKRRTTVSLGRRGVNRPP
jgi:hypothetical protein